MGDGEAETGPIGRTATILRRLRAFRRIHGWLIQDMLRQDCPRFPLAICLSIGGVAAQALSYVTVLFYVRGRINEEPVVLWNLSIPSEGTTPILLAWGGVAVGLAAMAAVVCYLGDSMSFTVARRYAEYGAGRVLAIVARPQPIKVPTDIDGPSTAPRFVLRVLGSGMNAQIRLIMAVVNVVSPLIMLVVAGVALFAISVPMTLVMGTVMLVFAVPFYWINKSVVRAARARELHGRRVGRTVVRLVTAIMQTRYTNGRDLQWGETFVGGRDLQQNLQALRGILVLKRQIDPIRELTFGVVLLVLLVMFGRAAEGGTISWDLLLAYLVALRWSMGSFTRVAASVTAMTRLLPLVARYVDFRRVNERRAVDTPEPTRHSGETFDWPLSLCVADDALPESLAQLDLNPGDSVCVVYPEEVARGTFSRFCDRLTRRSQHAGADLNRHALFQAAAAPPPLFTLRETIAGGGSLDAAQRDAVLRLLTETGVMGEFGKLEAELETVVDLDLAEHLSRRLAFMLGIMHGLVEHTPFVVLSGASLGRLSAKDRVQLLGLFQDRVVLVLFETLPTSAPGGMDHTIVIGENGIRGMGGRKWHRSILAFTNSTEVEPPDSTRGSDDESELDIEMSEM